MFIFFELIGIGVGCVLVATVHALCWVKRQREGSK